MDMLRFMGQSKRAEQRFRLLLARYGKGRMRPALLKDASAICQIYNEAVPSHVNVPSEHSFTEENVDGFVQYNLLAYAFSRSRHLWVLEINHEVVAWINLIPFAWGDYPTAHVGEVNAYIRSKWQGCGFATYLGRFMIELAYKEGFIALVAWVMTSNSKSNKSVFAGGGRMIGRVPKLVQRKGQAIDVNLYYLSLRLDT